LKAAEDSRAHLYRSFISQPCQVSCLKQSGMAFYYTQKQNLMSSWLSDYNYRNNAF